MSAFVAFLIGLAKGGLGGTLGSLATPLMALVLPADECLGLILPMLMLADVFAVAFYWKRWNRKLVWRMLPWGVAGVLGAMLFVTHTPAQTLQIILGIIVLVFALFKLFEGRILALVRYQDEKWHGNLTGAVAGLTSALAHNGGAPVAIYLLLQKELTPVQINATTAIFFAILNWVKAPLYLAGGMLDFQQIGSIASMLLFVPLGVWAGTRVAYRIRRDVFDRVVILFLLISAAVLILT